MPNKRAAFALIYMLSGAVVPQAQASAETVALPVDMVTAHLEARDATLGRQQQAARSLSRQHAWMAYRMSRKRAQGFFSNTQRRPDQARGAVMSLEVLERSLREEEKVAAERLRVQVERDALLGQRRSIAASAPASELRDLVSPTKGPVISAPGLRADAVTGVMLRDLSIHILARMDAPVVSPGSGIVKRVEALPAGGYAIVLAQQDGVVSVLLGLRVVDVSQGQAVAAGQRVGRVGRTLDGAPVLRLAVWKQGHPVDARELMPGRKSR